MIEHWPHAPIHLIRDKGIYMVTCGTYNKQHYLGSEQRRTYFMKLLFNTAIKFNWDLQAWSVLSNHYHFIANSPENPENLRDFMLFLHSSSATEFNKEDGTPGRKVWYQFWDNIITYQKSYYARLNYVKNNPVHHRIVDDAEEYFWCSASWFKMNASSAFAKTVNSFKIDTIKVYDNF